MYGAELLFVDVQRIEEFRPVQIWKHVRGRTLRGGCSEQKSSAPYRFGNMYGAELFVDVRSEKSSAPYRFGNMYGAELFVDVQRRVRPRTDLEITCTGPNSSWMFSREEFGPVQIWKHVRGRTLRGCSEQKSSAPYRFGNMYGAELFVADVQRRVRPRTDLETCTGPNSSWMFREEFGPVQIWKHVRGRTLPGCSWMFREEFGPVQIGKHVRGRTLRGCSEKSSAPYRFGNMYGAELFVDVQRRVRPRTDLETCTGPNSSWMFREEFGPVQIGKHVRGRTLRGCSEKSSAPYRFGNMYGAELFSEHRTFPDGDNPCKHVRLDRSIRYVSASPCKKESQVTAPKRVMS